MPRLRDRSRSVYRQLYRRPPTRVGRVGAIVRFAVAGGALWLLTNASYGEWGLFHLLFLTAASALVLEGAAELLAGGNGGLRAALRISAVVLYLPFLTVLLSNVLDRVR